MRTIYPTKAATWSLDGKPVVVETGKAVDHPNDVVADYLVASGAASDTPSKPGKGKAPPSTKQAAPPENK